MISSRSALDTTYVLATALSERVADAIALVVISALVLLALPAQPGWLVGAAKPFGILGLLGCDRHRDPADARIGWPDHDRTRPAASRTTRQPDHGHGPWAARVRAFHDARRLSGFLGLTVLIWCLDALGKVIAGSALGFRMPISAAFLLLAGLGLGSALPSTPGYVGIYQFVAVTVLTPFGFSRTDAIAYILVAQALIYVVIGFWGSLGLWRYRQTRRSV